MEYVLQYFEEFLDEYYMQDNDKHTYLGSNLYLEIDVEEVSTESQKILKEIRKVNYSVRPQTEIDEYLVKIFKRLLTIKVTIEEIADFVEVVLVESNSPKSNYSILRNFKSMYKGIHHVLNQLVLMNDNLKSNIGENESLDYRIRRTDTAEIIKRHEMLRNYIENNIEMKFDVIKEYNLDITQQVPEFKCSSVYNKDQFSYFSNYVFDLDRDGFNLTLKDYAAKDVFGYVKRKKGYEKRFYASVGLYLKKETVKLKEEKQQFDFIVDFLVFNNLCHDLVIGYFKSEVYKKLMSHNYKELFGYINEQVGRLEELPFSNTIKYFNSVLIGKKPKTTLNQKLQIFFNTLNRNFVLQDESSSDNVTGVKIEQMHFNGSAEFLGLLYELLISVELIQDNNEKSKIGRILSETTIVKGQKEKISPRTISDAFHRDYGKRDMENIDDMYEKVLHMLDILTKMKKKQVG